MKKTQLEVEKMLVDELIEEINFLAKEQKQRQLNDEELTYQKQLRTRYIELYKQNFKDNLASIKVVNPSGLDITPQKWKQKKNK